ncbi:MAG: hypothetical protein CL484_07605 [Acidobacteria bacterium]|nr:hypothetical protein [Acidobacteriota bacterium]|tara:strand:+ start:358 stop:1230 length:873 start_codon:yes stop_codon:yes gene_type:complete
MSDDHLGIGFPSNTRHVTAVSGGSWNADYPLAQAVSWPPVIGEPARSADLEETSTIANLVFDGPREARLVALINHNLSVDATYRVQFFDDEAMSAELYDSDWVKVWEETIPFGQAPWGAPGVWDGFPSEESRQAFIATAFHVAAQMEMVRAVRVSVREPGNEDDCFSVGQIEVADWRQPSVNYSYGLENGFEDGAITVRADGGAKYSDLEQQARITEFDLEYIPQDEAYSIFLELERQHGTAYPVFISTAPHDENRRQLLSFYGCLTDLPRLAEDSYKRHSVRIAIREEL